MLIISPAIAGGPWMGRARLSVLVRILGGMGALPAGESWPLPTEEGTPRLFRAVLPEWVGPAGRAVSDCYWLAYRAHVECVGGTPGAVAATLAWVAGGEPSPMTGRREQPVTRDVVYVEDFATSVCLHPHIPVPLRELCEERGVVFRPVLAADHVTAEWAGRVWRTLRWLTAGGLHGCGVAPPIALPRVPWGSAATAQGRTGWLRMAGPQFLIGDMLDRAARSTPEQGRMRATTTEERPMAGHNIEIEHESTRRQDADGHYWIRELTGYSRLRCSCGMRLHGLTQKIEAQARAHEQR